MPNQTLSNLKRYWNQLRAANEWEELFRSLNEYIKEEADDTRNMLILHQANYNRTQKDKMIGVLSKEQADIAFAQLTNRLGYLISEIESKDLINKTFVQPSPATDKDTQRELIDLAGKENMASTPVNGYALLIGLRYGHWSVDLKPLEGTLKDIKAIRNHFADPQKAGFASEHILTVTEENATAQGILDALDLLATKIGEDPDSSVIIYYSGHGETDGNQFFLVPYDFDLIRWRNEKTFDSEKVVLATVFAQKLAAIKAKKTLIVLDCCHAENIPVTKSLLGRNNFLTGALRDIDQVLDNQEPNQRNLTEQVQSGSGKVILTSCAANETSLDLGDNGLFTSVLLECLRGQNNLKRDGLVRLIDMIDYIPRKVKEEAYKYTTNGKPHQQNPVFKRIDNLSSEDFVICTYNTEQAQGLKGSSTTRPNAVGSTSHKQIPMLSQEKLDKLDKAVNTADYVIALDILDSHFETNPSQQYSILKQTIEHHLGQGLMPPPATSQGLKMLVRKLKRGE